MSCDTTIKEEPIDDVGAGSHDPQVDHFHGNSKMPSLSGRGFLCRIGTLHAVKLEEGLPDFGASSMDPFTISAGQCSQENNNIADWSVEKMSSDKPFQLLPQIASTGWCKSYHATLYML